jgi:3-deoxy-D-manno-octulosonic-acid transferase
LPPSACQHTFFKLYDLAWGAALPLLKRNHRLAEGFACRVLDDPPPRADVWIQAASAGEAYLAWSLSEHLLRDNPRLRVLLTTTTSQGLGILQQAAGRVCQVLPGAVIETTYFPFDRPAIMKQAVARVRPRVLVLLEAEIWPGMLQAARSAGTPVLIINGRLRATSLRHYRLFPGIWKALRPDHVAAISPEDSTRFRRLFPGCPVVVMRNIKFDCIDTEARAGRHENPLQALVSTRTGFLVLGSIREAEAPETARLMAHVLKHRPQTVIGLFPRHMHRLASWQRRLDSLGLPWQLRSQTAGPVDGPVVVLWDVFGELKDAYALAAAAFVGGSLKPLGGQNFLEAMVCGVRPVIGPHWEHFQWVGPAIVDQGLVRIAPDWQRAATLLAADLADPPPREAVQAAAMAYIRQRRGGSRVASRLIRHYLGRTPGRSRPL